MTRSPPPSIARVYERAAAEVVHVLRELISHDTTIAEHNDPPREEVAHQAFVGAYLRELGAEVELRSPAWDRCFYRTRPKRRGGGLHLPAS